MTTRNLEVGNTVAYHAERLGADSNMAARLGDLTDAAILAGIPGKQIRKLLREYAAMQPISVDVDEVVEGVAL